MVNRFMRKAVIGRFLGIIGWDSSVCKSNRLHVDILQFSFIGLKFIYEFLQNDW